MKMFSKDLFKRCKAIVKEACGCEGENDEELYFNDLYGHIDVGDGSSYDGFISFTEGYIETVFYFDPIRDHEWSGSQFSGVDSFSRKRAEFLNKYVDGLCDDKYIIENFYDDHKSEYPEFKSSDEMFKWWSDYLPSESSNERENEIYEKYLDYKDEFYNETPAFVKVRVCLYEGKYGKHEATVKSFFNDDFDYGRESVGAWAGKGGTGEGVGDHVIYSDSFNWRTPQMLYRGLKKRVPLAFSTL